MSQNRERVVKRSFDPGSNKGNPIRQILGYQEARTHGTNLSEHPRMATLNSLISTAPRYSWGTATSRTGECSIGTSCRTVILLLIPFQIPPQTAHHHHHPRTTPASM
eukprot:1626790-Rhodomonas_salina.3